MNQADQIINQNQQQIQQNAEVNKNIADVQQSKEGQKNVENNNDKVADNVAQGFKQNNQLKQGG